MNLIMIFQKKLTALFIISAAIFLLVSCNKSNNVSGPLIKGKLVRNLCVDPLVQILDSAYFYLGENWLDTNARNAILRENVFVIDNPCSYTSRFINEEEEFYFRIVADNRDCAVCAMYVESPATRHKIRVDN